MIKYPAKVDPSSDKYKGPVLFNPGGPGGSGVGLISNLGPSFQLIIGGEFDIIGFDPRGVGQTTPVVDVFPLPLERESFALRYLEAPFINQTSTALSQVMARATLVNQLIEERANVAAQYLNTAVVSTDMLSIVKAHGLDKLQYWGFSYGSVLGNSFATLYPVSISSEEMIIVKLSQEHVGRLVVDGVVDAEDYYAGLWSTNLRNTDRGLRLVFQQCAESGKECALNAPTAEDVEARYYKILDSLDSNPIIVHADDFSGIVIRKYVHAVMFMALYSPYRTMKLLFEAFRSLEKGDGLPFYQLVGGLIPSLSCNCESKPLPPVGRQEGQDAILCSDAYSLEADHEAMQKHFDHLSKISVFGDIWSEIRMACMYADLTLLTHMRFSLFVLLATPSFPLLMIDNSEDPVTPDAQKMSKAFKDTSIDNFSIQHCSIAASSICTFKVIRDYFREGVLPEEGTICEIEDHMFLVGVQIQILELLPNFVSTSCFEHQAFVLSFIAKADYPEDYPTLLSDLLALLSSGNTASIHGSMQVLSDFIRNELSEDQLLPILRQLHPLLLSVLAPQGGSEQQHSPLTRARAVAIFRQCVTALDMVRKEHPEAVAEAINSVLPQWLAAMHTLLSTPSLADVSDPTNWDAISIRIQVLRTLDVIQNSFGASLTPEMTQGFCEVVAKNLNELMPAFRTYYLLGGANSDKGGIDPPTPVSADDPDINLSLMHVACPALDFLGEVVRKSVRGSKVGSSWVTSNINDLLTLAVYWMQIPVEDEDIWEEDANAFVRDESEGVESYTARVASLDTIGDFLECYGELTAAWLWNAIQNAVKTAEQSKQAGNPDWWRLLEAVLFAVSSGDLVEMVEQSSGSGKPSPFDGQALLTNILPPILSEPGTPFLQGRAFVTASAYARVLPPALMGQYLAAAVEALESSTAGVPLKVAALKAVRNFCSIPDDKPIAPLGPRIIAALAPFMETVTEDSLALVLEALSTVTQVDNGKWLTPELATSIVGVLLKTYARNVNDPISLSITTDIFTFLASAEAPGVYQATVMATVPSLAPTIANNDGWICCSALQILTAVFDGAKNGLGEGVVGALAPSLFAALGKVSDPEAISEGCRLLTTLIRKDPAQLLGWSDSDGSTSLQRIGSFLGRLLSPDVEEAAGLATGDLLVTLFRKAGDAVAPMMRPLLEEIVKRLRTAKTATGSQ
ncbi:hypothetical protein FRC17_002742, partial [Serendipita sp. 399]